MVTDTNPPQIYDSQTRLTANCFGGATHLEVSTDLTKWPDILDRFR